MALVESDAAGRPQPRLLRRAQPAAADARRSTWRNDPAAFERLSRVLPRARARAPVVGPGGRLANYHEQWLSEGFAQYFAALYAQQARGDETFGDVLRQMRAGRIDESRSGPGLPRLPPRPHPGRQPRVPRASSTTRAPSCCTCCGGWSATRRSSAASGASTRTSRFQKAGTDDFRAAMEAEAGRPLDRFFERWIYGVDAAARDVQLPRRTGPAGQVVRPRSSRPARSSTCRSP